MSQARLHDPGAMRHAMPGTPAQIEPAVFGRAGTLPMEPRPFGQRGVGNASSEPVRASNARLLPTRGRRCSLRSPDAGWSVGREDRSLMRTDACLTFMTSLRVR